MSNILLVEPNYRSKFPPLGLMKIATYHKGIGDQVTFVRGIDQKLRNLNWHRIYVSSLFTWELPRTVKTVKYYASAVNALKDIYVGGIGATLLPDYVRQNVECTIVEGQSWIPRVGSVPVLRPSRNSRQTTAFWIPLNIHTILRMLIS